MADVLDSPGTAYLSHVSAASWWGLPGFALVSPCHTVIPWQGVTQRSRLTVVHYHRDLPIEHLTSLRGVPVTSPALTLFLLAGTEHRGRVERAVDNAWSMRLVTYDELHQLLGRLAQRGRNGIRMMRSLLEDRDRSFVPPESGLEARVSRLAQDVGVVLRRQVNVGGQSWIGRVDFQVERSNRVVEVLSERYHGSPVDRMRDEVRFRELGEAGFEVLRIWDHEIWSDPETVRERIHAFSRGVMDPGLFISARKRGEALAIWRGDMDPGASISAPE
jgi:very-short-patch-repair endonuclease